MKGGIARQNDKAACPAASSKSGIALGAKTALRASRAARLRLKRQIVVVHGILDDEHEVVQDRVALLLALPGGLGAPAAIAQFALAWSWFFRDHREGHGDSCLDAHFAQEVSIGN